MTHVRLTLLAGLFAIAASAQTQPVSVPINLNLSGTGSVGTDFHGTGSGTIAPFGQANVTIALRSQLAHCFARLQFVVKAEGT